MDFYHSWMYIYILNTKWFVWSVIVTLLLLNIVSPIIVWALMNSKPIPLLNRLTKGKQKVDETAK